MRNIIYLQNISLKLFEKVINNLKILKKIAFILKKMYTDNVVKCLSKFFYNFVLILM